MHVNSRVCASLPVLIASSIALAACSSGGGSSGGGSSGAGAAATTTVAVRSTGAGDVLTDATGATLYVSDQEHGTALCKSSACTAIWLPLTVRAGTTPTGPSALSAPLTTLKRPDETMQVALAGKPLYRFYLDHAAGDTSGNGQRDSFDGTNFTWHAATPSGALRPAPSGVTTSGYNGGY
jgi:predicted lipoprotein with Yx(FWY)xxD motif